MAAVRSLVGVLADGGGGTGGAAFSGTYADIIGSLHRNKCWHRCRCFGSGPNLELVELDLALRLCISRATHLQALAGENLKVPGAISTDVAWELCDHDLVDFSTASLQLAT